MTVSDAIVITYCRERLSTCQTFSLRIIQKVVHRDHVASPGAALSPCDVSGTLCYYDTMLGTRDEETKTENHVKIHSHLNFLN